MQPDTLSSWQKILAEKARALYPSTDPSHDILHINRVVAMATKLAAAEGADPYIVIPAAYLHDFVNLAKDDPRRKMASTLSADAAVEYLKSISYPAQYFDAIRHAIAAHSFSAGIACQTIEAKVVQDADRLDALGAIGIARCFSTNAKMGTAFYGPDDMLCETREANDKQFAVDHFFAKLFKLPDMMNTEAAKAEARKRVDFMRRFLAQLQNEAA